MIPDLDKLAIPNDSILREAWGGRGRKVEFSGYSGQAA